MCKPPSPKVQQQPAAPPPPSPATAAAPQLRIEKKNVTGRSGTAGGMRSSLTIPTSGINLPKV